MSFREKSAWITLVTFLGCFGVYFGAILTGRVSPRGWDTFRLLATCVHVLLALQIVLHIVALIQTPKGERTLRDERERLIQWRSHTIGYYVLIVSVVAIVIPGHMGHGVVDLMNFALFDVALAIVVVS